MNLRSLFAAARPLVACSLLLVITGSLGGNLARAAEPVEYGNRISLGDSLVSVAETGAPVARGQASVVRPTLTAAELAGRIRFEVTVRMHDLGALQARQALGERVKPTEIADKYLPTQAEFDAVASWLTAEGFTIERRDAHRLAVFASGTIRQTQEAFQTRFAEVSMGGHNDLAAVSAPSVPASLTGVLGVVGLQPFQRFQPASMPKPATSDAPPYLVNEILGAFNCNTGLTGDGEEIGIIIDATPAASDLKSFWSQNNSSATVNNFNVYPTADPDGGDDSASGPETFLSEWTSAVAPAAEINLYVTGDYSVDDVEAAYSYILTQLGENDVPGMDQLVLGYFMNESGLSSSEIEGDAQDFANMVSYGVTILAPSGDNGAFDQGASSTLGVTYPASDVSVTGIGGASVTLNTSTGAISSLTAWSAGASALPNGEIGASGGGQSATIARPTYQKGTGVPSGTKRCVPDVTLPADPAKGGMQVFNGTTSTAGGTIWAAATWAGLIAQINEARANQSEKPVGLLNTLIYPLLGTDSFTDITSGRNGHHGQTDGFASGTGYDEVTGLGAPNGKNLLTTLGTGAPTITSISPTSGAVGGTVVIKGTNFVPPLSITFGGNVQASGSFTSTQITATVPSGAQTGTISVTASGGTVTSAQTFTVTSSQVQFADASYTVDENAGSITASVTRTGTSSGAVSVTCETASGTAKSGTDYTGKSSTISWASGDTTAKSFTVTLADLGITDGSTRDFSLKLSAPAGTVLGSPATATVTIDENDQAPTLTFGTSAYGVNENAGSITVHVLRSGTSVGAISVKCATASGTAVSGTDYTGVSQTLTWADGDTSQKAFTVAIKDLGLTNGTSRAFSLDLSSPSGATLGTPDVANVTIHENDPTEGEFDFAAASYSVSETAGTLTVHVNRRFGTTGAVTVVCATSSGTAKSGTDYSGKSQTFSWAAGDSAQMAFTIAINNRGSAGGNGLSFNIVLSSPTGGAALTTPSSVPVTITN